MRALSSLRKITHPFVAAAAPLARRLRQLTCRHFFVFAGQFISGFGPQIRKTQCVRCGAIKYDELTPNKLETKS